MQRFTTAFEETKQELQDMTSDLERSLSLSLAAKLNSEDLPQKLQDANLVNRITTATHLKQVWHSSSSPIVPSPPPPICCPSPLFVALPKPLLTPHPLSGILLLPAPYSDCFLPTVSVMSAHPQFGMLCMLTPCAGIAKQRFEPCVLPCLCWK